MPDLTCAGSLLPVTRANSNLPQVTAAGHAGEMKYMEARDERGQLKRASLSSVAPWARSVVVCAINYNTANPYSIICHEPSRGWISRYAWSREDYHDSVLRRLKLVEEQMWWLPTH